MVRRNANSYKYTENPKQQAKLYFMTSKPTTQELLSAHPYSSLAQEQQGVKENPCCSWLDFSTSAKTMCQHLTVKHETKQQLTRFYLTYSLYYSTY